MVPVSKMLELVGDIAPFELAEEWDNVGLLAGHPDWPVARAMVALDLTDGALREAAEKGVQLIVTHHPILLNGRKNLREDDGEGALLAALIRARIALIAAHTNYDSAPGGMNDVLAAALGLSEPETARKRPCAPVNSRDRPKRFARSRLRGLAVRRDSTGAANRFIRSRSAAVRAESSGRTPFRPDATRI